jgi:uncharacterized membrane-anchored protein YjiN (DUF445 family)
VRAFAEAAMVGACADWFAVTALFRRPLGLPIPHTAIIPRSKERIGEALGQFIVENFLSLRVLNSRLRQLELAAWGGAWLERPQNARAVARRILAWAPEVIRAMPPQALEQLLGSIAQAAARSVPAAPTASRLLAALWDDGRAEPLIERGTELLATYISNNQDVILEKVHDQSWKWLPKWVDRAIARKITAGLLQLALEVRNPDHPWRKSFAAAIESLIVQLANDPEFRRRGEDLKSRLMADPRVGAQARRLLSDMQGQLEDGWADRSEEMERRIQGLVSGLGGWLREDPDLQRTLNTTAKAFVRGVLAPRRHEIGRFVAQVVDGWDTRSIVDRLELQIGPDLQYIRVSGTLVGGLVGLSLFALSRIFGRG